MVSSALMISCRVCIDRFFGGARDCIVPVEVAMPECGFGRDVELRSCGVVGVLVMDLFGQQGDAPGRVTCMSRDVHRVT